ncbi:flap endonuclease 1-like isoform X2 [Schistocerca gregaria]|nr:flap endonuclease 1-like isoform X2 [Schistocerca gregaria]
MMECGIKPVYVFDGKPPELKNKELSRRAEKRKEAEYSLAKAKEEGDLETIAKANKRIIFATSKHTEDSITLLKLMGVPCVKAPAEAEAQCAAFVKSGVCYAVASEDMDALTYGTNILIRHLSYSGSQKEPLLEIHLSKVIQNLEMNMNQLIDLSILLGSDYCQSIKGIGPKKAVSMMKKYGTIEKILENLDTKKYTVPDNFCFNEIRQLFSNPNVIDPNTYRLEWNPPDEQGLIDYLVKKKGFFEDRVRRGIEKLKKFRTLNTQERITSFFLKMNNEKLDVKKTEEKPKIGTYQDITEKNSDVKLLEDQNEFTFKDYKTEKEHICQCSPPDERDSILNSKKRKLEKLSEPMSKKSAKS